MWISITPPIAPSLLTPLFGFYERSEISECIFESHGTTHSNTAVGNVTNERPSHTSIPTGIQVELGLGKVGRDRVTGHENGTRWEATGGFVEVEEVWLVSHTPAVDRVLP
jgi:hypothetical protein